MSWLLISAVVSLGQMPYAVEAVTRDSASQAPRRLADIDRSMREAIRADAAAQTDLERLEAVRQMAEIYLEILADPRMATSDTLKSNRARLWSRMTRIKRDTQRRLQREQRQAAQQSKNESPMVELATRSLSDQITLMTYSTGGPSYVFQESGVAMGGGAVQDHAQELIDLIQRTIRPDFWDATGGPGSMFYYRPLMALVVSATSEVHDNVGGLLKALRRAGQ
ncbi:MAG: hypothetical protein EA424_21675 [Planctomycetaceae bacterium]|nr:MAG: hypothetical protein EA424_21675 [Planctomycetaceae bacterium]